ncbi:MAG: hypothetical protein IT221_03995 [Fluviicola sp.]|nr:hypothetical protein [Fluviicola sp.]
MSEYEQDKYTYNRIVIIGNGYDRALGMATSYSDFLLDYLKKCIKSAMTAPYHSDVFIRIERINYQNNQELWVKIESIESIPRLFEFCKDRVKFSSKSELLELMLDKLDRDNWVDIETLYFNLLVQKVEHIKKTNVLKRDFAPVKRLNEVFENICLALNDYITRLDKEFNIDFLATPLVSLNYAFKEKQTHTKAYIAHQKADNEIGDPENILFLNFNYTNSLYKMFNSTLEMRNHHILHIHGQIGNSKNPIIFGYGDDTHHYYKEIEIEDSFDPMLFIKSFHYPKTENYHTLLDFMSSGKYEVYIVGHSCGLSDRTLLKAIFEDNNCLAIKIFHRGSNEEHFLKNIAISRHFENKSSLRKKIMPYDEYAVIPQSKR